MARTNAAAVQLVIDTGLTVAQIDAFIDDASAWVDTHLVGRCDRLGVSELTIIEKYLSAYFITLREPRITEKRRQDVWDTYQRDKEASEYLKVAAKFDPCGIVEDAFKDSDGRRFLFRVGKGFDDTLDLPESSS